MDVDRGFEASGSMANRSLSGFGPPSMALPGGDAARRQVHTWQPLAGEALLERLRITGRPRPRPDPGFVATLRRWLDSGLSLPEPGEPGQRRPATAGSGRSSRHGGPRPLGPLVVTKDRLTRVLACEAHQVAVEFGERPLTAAMACGALVDVLFRQLVTVGSIGDPLADALAGLEMDERQAGLRDWITRRRGAERDELVAEVERQASGLVRRWPALEPGWLPRTQEALRVAVAGGAVELSARVDLAIGRPIDDQSSVAIVEIKSGTRRIEHRNDLHFYALIESLRNPAPPFVVATYYTRTGEIDVEPVSEEVLAMAARRTLEGARQLKALASGSEPRRSPGGLCGTCAALPGCDVGRRYLDTVDGTKEGDLG